MTKHLARWGLDLKQLDADYHFASTLRPIQNEPAAAGVLPALSTIARSPAGRDLALYVSDRIRVLPRLLIDVGVRGERQTYGRDRGLNLGPRLNAALTVTDRTMVRLGWARVSQPMRIDELAVEDGVVDFRPPERAEHRTLAVARAIAGGGELRVSVYQTLVRGANPRFENVFEPVGFLPAASDDRVRVAADRARAEGVEVAANGGPGNRLGWSAAYALAL